MITRLLKYGTGVLVASYVLFGAEPSVQQKKSDPQGDSYASIAKLPDWSGAWVIPFDAFRSENIRERDPKNPDGPAWTPDYAAMQAALRTRVSTGKDSDSLRPLRQNSESCLPTGMPNLMKYSFAIEFLFNPGRVTILAEQDSTIRRIYTDGRTHTEDPEITYTGESIGHWEGETLVIDTTAISPKAELMAGLRTSGKTHITERVHLKDKNHLQIDTVVEDTVALKNPWRYTRIYERSASEFFERICLDNNRDANGDEPDLKLPNP